MKKGTIALDIDGTITNKEHLIPDGVAHYFETLYREGWQFIFVTGRPLSFAMLTLPKLPFPFLLGVQNGADLLEMPSKKKVDRFYLKMDIINFLDDLYQGNEGDFLVYSGYEKGDICYYRPDRFSKEMQEYLKEIEKFSAAPWKPVKTFDIKEQKTFPLIKCLGTKEMMEQFDHKLKGIEGITTTLIKDPISATLYLILITHKNADKGVATETFIDKFSLKRPLITGGDDNNDIPLLKKGDIRIAMDGSPLPLQSLAHIIAPPAEEMGIIKGIQQAIQERL